MKADRVRVLAGNWKMNNGPSTALSYFKGFAKTSPVDEVRRVIFPPAYALGSEIQDAAKKASIALGAQNVHWEEKGAFTGELSPSELLAMGINWVLIAHSERRQFFGETDETARKRFDGAARLGLNVIYCLGETLEERESGQMQAVLSRQLKPFLSVLQNHDATKSQAIFTLAYEPVWAIGTGKTATEAQAQEAHAFLRSMISAALGDRAANAVSILYGGSVTAENAAALLGLPDVDGVLVGGASLKPESFSKILSC